MKKLKVRIFDVIQAAKTGDRLSRAFDLCIICLIILNVLFVILDTFNLPNRYRTFSTKVEQVSAIIFTIEYLLRLWTSDLLHPDVSPWIGRLKYIFSFMALIDLFAILPFYIPFIFPVDLRVLRTLRVVRLFRIFKFNRYTNALNQISAVFRKKSSQLFSSMFIVFLLMVIASVIMYNVENPAQPEKFDNAFSGLWWAIATLTTVGYGDIYPITPLGRILSAVIALLGIGLVAVPTGIVSAGFIEQIDKESSEDKEKHYCPYCGKRID